MSYTIRYTGTRREMLAKSLGDAKDFLGNEYAERIINEFVKIAHIYSLRYVVKRYRILLLPFGLQGVPADAIMNEAIKRYRKMP